MSKGDKMKLTLEEWIAYGVRNGYCSELYCENHDGTTWKDVERFGQLLDEYGERDFCWPIVRIYNGGDG